MVAMGKSTRSWRTLRSWREKKCIFDNIYYVPPQAAGAVSKMGGVCFRIANVNASFPFTILWHVSNLKYVTIFFDVFFQLFLTKPDFFR